VVALPQNAILTPQTHEATIEPQTEVVNAGLASPSAIPRGAVGGVPGGVPGGQLGGVIGGVISGTGGGLGSGSGGGVGGGIFRVGGGMPRPDATELAENLEAGTNVGETRELVDLFEYKLKDRVTIRKSHSALVPFLQSRIDAEKVSVWNPSDSSVLRALWVNNTCDLTFDGGSFNVLEGDAFAGEGLMDAIKPGEKRLMSYAADLGVLVDAKQKADNQRVTKVIIAHGAMTQSTQER
jgi:hypothetical protein